MQVINSMSPTLGLRSTRRKEQHSSSNFFLELGGRVWKIQGDSSGINKQIMRAFYGQLTAMLGHYSKVLLIRVDLRPSMRTTNNALISQLIRYLRIEVKKKYGCQLGYLWVREQQEQAVHHHYHLVFMLNGHKAKKMMGLKKLIDKIEPRLAPARLCCHWPTNSEYWIYRNDFQLVQQAIYRVSYLAKNRTKGNKLSQTSNFQASRLKPI